MGLQSRDEADGEDDSPSKGRVSYSLRCSQCEKFANPSDSLMHLWLVGSPTAGGGTRFESMNVCGECNLPFQMFYTSLGKRLDYRGLEPVDYSTTRRRKKAKSKEEKKLDLYAMRHIRSCCDDLHACSDAGRCLMVVKRELLV